MKKQITSLVVVLLLIFLPLRTIAMSNTIDYFIYNDTIFKLDFNNKVDKKSLASLIGLLEIPKQTEETTFVNQTKQLFSGLALYEIKNSLPEKVLAIELNNQFFLAEQTTKENVVYFEKEPQEIDTEEINTEVVVSEEIINKEESIETNSTDEVPTEQMDTTEVNSEQATTEEVPINEIENEIIPVEPIKEDVDIDVVVPTTETETEVQETPVIDSAKETNSTIPSSTIKESPKTESVADRVEPNKIIINKPQTPQTEVKETVEINESPINESSTTPTHMQLEDQTHLENANEMSITAPTIKSSSSQQQKSSYYFMLYLLLGVAFIITLTFITYKMLNKNEK